MIEAPTLKSFLLRSRAFWLTIFTVLFFSWAWWDSMEYSTELHYGTKSGRVFSIHSCDGGIGYSQGEDVRFFVKLFSAKVEFGDMQIFRGRVLSDNNGKLYILYSRPDITYWVLVLITLGLISAWLAWRWRILRKRTHEHLLANS